MNPFRTKALRRAALEALSLAGSYALPESSLRTHVGDLQRPHPTDEEWADTVAWLRDKELIASVESALDPDLIQWAITERGRTILATL